MIYSESFGKHSSKILLGTAYFGSNIPEEIAFSIMDRFVELGGNHIDTARMYSDGESEKIVAKWQKSRNNKDVFVSTKGGFPYSETPDVSRISENEIRIDIEESLKALQTETIDFYWLHRDDETIPAGEIIETMNKLVKEGKIKRFGASNWRSYRIRSANDYAKENALMGFEASQIRFSPAVTAPSGNADQTLVEMTEDEFRFYKANNLPVAAYASQAKGFFSKMAISGKDGLSDKAKERYLCSENLSKFEYIMKLSEKYECSVASIVCGSLCSINKPNIFPIIGGRTVGQIEDSMCGADLALEAAELRELFGYSID